MRPKTRTLGCLMAISLVFTSVLAKAQAEDALRTEDQVAAMVFFNRIAQETTNPYIKVVAQENAERLASKSNPTQITQHEIPVITQADGSVAVPVLLNDKTMGTFIIDTGSSYTVITPRMAAKLGVEVSSETPMVSIITANGVIKAPLVTLRNVTIGQVRVNEVQAVVQDLGKDLMLSGLLGMNFFKGKSLTINNDRLILEEAVSNQQLTSR